MEAPLPFTPNPTLSDIPDYLPVPADLRLPLLRSRNGLFLLAEVDIDHSSSLNIHREKSGTSLEMISATAIKSIRGTRTMPVQGWQRSLALYSNRGFKTTTTCQPSIESLRRSQLLGRIILAKSGQ